MTSKEVENVVYCPELKVSFKNSPYNVDYINGKNLKGGTEEKPVKKLGFFEFRTKIVWFNAIGFLFMHLVGIYGLGLALNDFFHGKLLTFSWMMLLVFLGGEGITIGAHRLWTHRSFKAKTPLQIILIIFQTLAGQNCCYVWARDHRQHHKYSDTDADPHNASRGFFFSHIGWLMMKKHPDVISKGKGVDMSDLEANPIIMFQKKYYKSMYVVFAMLIPVLTPVFLWNEDLWKSVWINFFGRYILLLNITWCVNSVAHMFGTKPYDKNILPVESNFVSFIGLGEGWHNYHHVFPWDYKASEFGMKYNFTATLIEWFSKIGWTYDLKEASHNVMVNRIKRCGDGSHPIYSDQHYSEESDKKFMENYSSKHIGEELEAEEDIEEINKTENNEQTLRQRSKEVRHG